MARNKYDIDEVMEDKFDLNQLKRVFQYVKPYRGQLTFALFLMLSSSALTMLFPMFISEIMDTYIPEKNIQAIVAIAILSLIIVLYTCVCIRLKIRITSRIGQAIVHQLRSDIFSHLQELPFSYYDDRPHGKIQVRVVNYVNSLSDLLSNGIINTITDMCNLIFILIFMFLLRHLERAEKDQRQGEAGNLSALRETAHRIFRKGERLKEIRAGGEAVRNPLLRRP